MVNDLQNKVPIKTENLSVITQGQNNNDNKGLKKVIIPPDGKCYVGAYFNGADLTHFYSPLWYLDLTRGAGTFFHYAGKDISGTGTDIFNYMFKPIYGQNVMEPTSLSYFKNSFEQRTGKKLSVMVGFQQWFDQNSWSWMGFPKEFCNYAYSQETVPMITWEPAFFPGKDYSKFHLDNIIQALDSKKGKLYEYMLDWAVAAKKYDKPIFLRPAHEMNGNWYTWCGLANGANATEFGDPAKADGPERYAIFWEKLNKLFVDAGANNVSFIWCINGQSMPEQANIVPWNLPMFYYPGNSTVDWIGADGYKKRLNQDFGSAFFDAKSCFITDNKLSPLGSYFHNTYEFNAFLSKPRGICEFSSGEYNTKPDFFREVLQNAKSYNMKLVGLFNTKKLDEDFDYRIISPLQLVDGDNKYLLTLNTYNSNIKSDYFIGQTIPVNINTKDIKIEAELTEEIKIIENLLDAANKVSKAQLYFKKFGPVKPRSKEYDSKMVLEFMEVYDNMLLQLTGLDVTYIDKYMDSQEYMGIFRRLGNELSNAFTYIQGEGKSLTCFSDLKQINNDDTILEIKKNFLIKSITLLASASKNTPYYIRAIDKLKSMYWSWVEEEKKVKKNAEFNISIDEVNATLKKSGLSLDFSDFNKAVYFYGEKNDAGVFEDLTLASVKFEKGKRMTPPEGRSFYKFRFISMTWGMCDEIIRMLDDKGYCDRIDIKSPEIKGLKAAALAQQAHILIEQYSKYSKSYFESAEGAKEGRMILDIAQDMLNESLSLIDNKEKSKERPVTVVRRLLSYAGDAIENAYENISLEISKAMNDTDARTEDIVKDDDFYLKKQIQFDMAQIKAETGDTEGAMKTYNMLISDKYLSPDFKNKVKWKIYRILWKKAEKGDKEARSKAIGILIELGKEKGENIRATNEREDVVEKNWPK